MRLPALLLRNKKDAYKNQFGHVLVLAGSESMLGAAALTGLAAMRSGAGLTTIGVPQSLNLILQKKISNVIMTWPLPETLEKSFSLKAYKEVEKTFLKYDAYAIGPGIGKNNETSRFVLNMIERCPRPLVIDADALNILAANKETLRKAKGPRILTPHPGEMARLTGFTKIYIEENRKTVAKNFAKQFGVYILLKGNETVVADPLGKVFINRVGNAGMATAGSGDVLTGIIAAFLAQGLNPFEAAQWGAHVHGLAGDIAAGQKSKISLIASDIIEYLPLVFKKISRN